MHVPAPAHVAFPCARRLRATPRPLEGEARVRYGSTRPMKRRLALRCTGRPESETAPSREEDTNNTTTRHVRYLDRPQRHTCTRHAAAECRARVGYPRSDQRPLRARRWRLPASQHPSHRARDPAEPFARACPATAKQLRILLDSTTSPAWLAMAAAHRVGPRVRPHPQWTARRTCPSPFRPSPRCAFLWRVPAHRVPALGSLRQRLQPRGSVSRLLPARHRAAPDPPHADNANAIVERMPRTLKDSVSILSLEHRAEWNRVLPHAVIAIRANPIAALGLSPLFFGVEFRQPADAALTRDDCPAAKASGLIARPRCARDSRIANGSWRSPKEGPPFVSAPRHVALVCLLKPYHAHWSARPRRRHAQVTIGVVCALGQHRGLASRPTTARRRPRQRFRAEFYARRRARPPITAPIDHYDLMPCRTGKGTQCTLTTGQQPFFQ
jgi:hypothetical protein